MAEIIKWNASQVLPIIRHNMRNFEDGNSGGNEDIKPELTSQNYSLLYRGKTCKEVNKYRKDIEKECFKYNRKNLVHAVEVVIQCPADCPQEQKTAFFQESFEHICSTLPMGKDCVFVAEVHVDEKHFAPDGTLVSKDHLHLMYVPAVPDTKHDNFQYKLCADDLTKRANLRELHPSLQAHLDKKGIHATVYQKKDGDGKTIGLSVKQLKEITEKTGIKIDKSITVDEFAKILSNNVEMGKTIQQKDISISELQGTVEQMQTQIRKKDIEISNTKSADITTEKELNSLKEQLHTKEQESQQLKQQIHSVKEEYELKTQELEKAQEKITELENKSHTIEAPKEQTWGASSGWGSSTGWGNNDKNKTVEVDV